MSVIEAMPAPADLLRIANLSRAQLERVLGLALQMKSRPQKWYKALRGQSLAGFFEQPAAGTRVSFAAAAYRLGMQPIILRPDELQLDSAEVIGDTARVLSSYASAIVIRGFAQDTLEQIADAATVPVINALSAEHHPGQALADLLTLREHFGRLQGLRLAYIGDANNVAHSLIEAGALAGMRVTVAAPPAYLPDRAVVRQAERAALDHGGSLCVINDPLAAVLEADVLYTNVWDASGDPEVHARRVADLSDYQVNAALMARARPHAVFMHCLPAHRGEEVSAEVIDVPASLVWAQAANHLPIEQAVIYLLISGRWDERGEI